MKLDRGAVVLVGRDPTVGHEQHGARPCVVVSDPDVAAEQRYPNLGVVPISATPGSGSLYPPLEPERSGLRKPSFALVDQVRSVDKRRVTRAFGRVTTEELRAIDSALAHFLGLEIHSP